MTFPVITKLPDLPTKPDAISDTWNTRYVEIDDNFDLLENSVAAEFWNGQTFAVPPGTGSTNGHIINDEGSPLAQKVNLDFIGASVSAADGASNTEITVNGAVIGKNIESITANKTLTDADEPIQVLTPDAAWDVNLPAEAVTNPYFIIVNPSGSGFTLTVKDDGAASITTVADGETKMIIPDGVTWYVLAGGGGSASPLTTKGDVYGFSTVDDRLPVGSVGEVISPDPTESLGVGWMPISIQSIMEGRLTLETGVPISITDQLAKTSIYLTRYKGKYIGLYNTTDTRWDLFLISEQSVAVPATTVTPFDIFAYDNAGVAALETLDWTDDTTRATALTLQDGVLVKSGNATRRYIGTGRTTSVSGQCEDSEVARFLWSYNNRVKRRLEKSDGSVHTYSSTTTRYWNNDSTQFAEVLIGVAEDVISFLAGSLKLKATTNDDQPFIQIRETDPSGTLIIASTNEGIRNFLMGNTGIESPIVGYKKYIVAERAQVGGGTFTQFVLRIEIFG